MNADSIQYALETTGWLGRQDSNLRISIKGGPGSFQVTAKVGSARVDLRGPLSYHTGSFCSSLDADVLRPPNANARQL